MRSDRRRLAATTVAALVVLTACTSGKQAASTGPATSMDATSTSSAAISNAPSTPGASSVTPVPPGHVVVVMMENHSFADVIGYAGAPYLNALAARGAELTQMYAITHPSQPNYVALFSGGTQGVSGDQCPQTLTVDNLGHQLIASGSTFTGYSEGLPATGAQTCTAGPYARKHAPWTDFPDLSGSVSQPLTLFPTDFTRLPALSFVIPNLDHDMHDGSVTAGDSWLRDNLASYATWAATHDSQLVITWDEDDRSADNHVPALIVGAGITPQHISTHLTHYSLLRWLEDRFAVPHLGAAATATPIPLPT